MDGEENQPEKNLPEKNGENIGALVGIIVIVMIFALGAWYIFRNLMN